MGLMLNSRERAQLAEAACKQKRVRTWRRMRAIELLAEGRRPEANADWDNGNAALPNSLGV